MADKTTAAPNAGVTLANVQVVNHLLFHKAIIDDDGSPERINQYLAMVREGEHVSLKNEFDRSIALVFDLVIQEQLNVWDVDLVHFSELYLKRAREEKIDLVTAGRIILMAWTVLKLQSDDLVKKFERRQEETVDMDWRDISDSWEMPQDEFAVTQQLLNNRRPIDEKIWHEGDRPVTLMELVSAFELAKQESEQRQVLNTQREAYKTELRRLASASFHGRVHREDLEEDIRLIWDRICSFNGGLIELNALYDDRDIWDRITAFNSVLFLHRDRKIQLAQDNFPYGPVQLRNLTAPGAAPAPANPIAPDDENTPEVRAE
ncbi:MAG TPA: segregation/condensation protein A [Candidatus Thermoplasmatota archaeon]|nr:segregation/condensation protein A [Candidatus Thermoplasmatota archaeon]